MFTPSLLDAPRKLVPVQVLSPVGVVPTSQGRGVGSALIRRGLEILAERSVPVVFVEDRRRTTRASASSPAQTSASGSRRRIPDAAFRPSVLRRTNRG